MRQLDADRNTATGRNFWMRGTLIPRPVAGGFFVEHGRPIVVRPARIAAISHFQIHREPRSKFPRVRGQLRHKFLTNEHSASYPRRWIWLMAFGTRAKKCVSHHCRSEKLRL